LENEADYLNREHGHRLANTNYPVVHKSKPLCLP